MVTRSRLLAAHGLTSCLSVRTQPLTATGAPSQTSTMPHHATTFSSVHFTSLRTDLHHTRTQPLTATGAPSQTSAMPCHAMPHGQGSFGSSAASTQVTLPSISMVDSVACLRCAERSRAPDYITNGHGFPMQTASCTWPQVVPVGEDPAAHGHWYAFTDLCHAWPCGHWCAFTDLYHAMPCHATLYHAMGVLPSTVQFDATSGHVWL